MRRMLRILFWLGLGLSTVLFVGTGVLWARSMGHREWWTFYRFEPRPDWTAPELAGQGVEHWWSATAVRGRIWLGRGALAPNPRRKSPIEHTRVKVLAEEADRDFDAFFEPRDRSSPDGSEWGWRSAGMGFTRWRGPVGLDIGVPYHEGSALAIPFWMLAAIFGLWPVCFALRRLLRRRRYGAGLCPSCGYDLRATPDRCPECGRVMSKS